MTIDDDDDDDNDDYDDDDDDEYADPDGHLIRSAARVSTIATFDQWHRDVGRVDVTLW